MRDTMSEAVYAIITDRILSLLEKGTVPWHKPWRAGYQAPSNLISGKAYRGINTFILNAASYGSPYWLSFKQAQGLGGNVRKGERACPVVFWKWLEKADPKTGEPERIPFLRYYSVFNIAQCENIPADKIPASDTPTHTHSPVEAAERIVGAMPKAPEIRHGQGRAFYSPRLDFVGMPDLSAFPAREEYYSTLFHELAHSTGHKERLNRKGVNGSDGDLAQFGSDRYAKEELVAEMGAAFLCGECAIVERTLDNSAAYVAGWLARLKGDAKLVVQAAAQAQKAADFILARQFTTENL